MPIVKLDTGFNIEVEFPVALFLEAVAGMDYRCAHLLDDHEGTCADVTGRILFCVDK